jgi:anthranilate synthase component 2
MILLIDNYDSFTWNLYQALARLGARVQVVRNDALSVEQALARRPNGIVLSPGPGRPKDAGICPSLLRALPRSRADCRGWPAVPTAHTISSASAMRASCT